MSSYNRLWIAFGTGFLWYGYAAPALVSSSHTELVIAGILGCFVPVYLAGKPIYEFVVKQLKPKE